MEETVWQNTSTNQDSNVTFLCRVDFAFKTGGTAGFGFSNYCNFITFPNKWEGVLHGSRRDAIDGKAHGIGQD